MLQAVVAIRFCPQLFQLRETPGDSNTCEHQPQHPFQLAYRMVFAMATLDSIIIYDTQVAMNESFGPSPEHAVP